MTTRDEAIGQLRAALAARLDAYEIYGEVVAPLLDEARREAAAEGWDARETQERRRRVTWPTNPYRVERGEP